MPRQIRILPLARMDMDDIWEFIARDSVMAANRVEDDLQQAIRELVRFPEKGHRRDDVHDKTLRFWKIYSYLVAFRHDDQSLTVVRVIHGSRNLGRQLGKT